MSCASPSIIVDEAGSLARLDAFNRQYVSQPFTLIDYYGKYGLDSREVETNTATGGTVTANTGASAATLAVTGTSGSTAQLVTKTFFRYQSGRGQSILMTLWHTDTGQTGQRRRWGYGTPDATTPEGVGWELNGTTLTLVRYSNVTGVANETVPRSSWIDPLDGTGPSGITLDITKGNIYEISFQWLGVGIVEFRINNTLIYRMVNPNLYAGPYMRSATHPVAFEIQNTAASTASSMNVICINVTSQGGEEPPQFSFAAQNTSDYALDASYLPVLAIRPTATFNSVTNRMLMLPRRMSVQVSNDRMFWRLLSGNSLSITGGSWVAVGGESGMEVNVTGTGFTGGELVRAGYLGSVAYESQTYDLRDDFGRLGRKIRNTLYGGQEVCAIVAQRDTVGASCRAAITWHEVR